MTTPPPPTSPIGSIGWLDLTVANAETVASLEARLAEVTARGGALLRQPPG